MRDVFVAGTGISPFTDKPAVLVDQVLEAGLGALQDAGVSYTAVQSVHTGYINAPLMTGVRVMKEFGLTGAPVQHVENASATGLATFHEAWRTVAGGHADIALAIAFDNLSAAGTGLTTSMNKNSLEGAILPAAFFAMWARRRMHEHGTEASTFAAIAAKNWNHARTCSWAQRRSDHDVTVEEVLASRMIAEPHTSKMSCAVGSGAAAAVLVSADGAKKLATGSNPVRVLTSVMRSETYTPGHLFLGPVVGPGQMTADASSAAYEAAGVGPGDIDLVQVHDAFPVEELAYYELLGICAEGDGDKLVANGDTSLGGRIPFSTDGGLIARGHPGGPTGLAQVHETFVQLTGRAGSRQVEGARTGMCHLVGAGSTCVVTILQA